jgi:hypothetical protein
MSDAPQEEAEEHGESRPATGAAVPETPLSMDYLVCSEDLDSTDAAVPETTLSVDDLVCSEDLDSIDTKDDKSVNVPDKESSMSSIVANPPAMASVKPAAKKQDPSSTAAASMRSNSTSSGKQTNRKRQAKQFYGDADTPAKKQRKVPSKDRAKAKSKPPRRPTSTGTMDDDRPANRGRKRLEAPPLSHSAKAVWNARLREIFQGVEGGAPAPQVSALEILQQAQERLTLPPTTFPPRDSPLNSVFQQGYSRVDAGSSPSERNAFAALEKCYIFILSQDVHDETAIRQKYQAMNTSEQVEAMRHLQGESARLRAREESLTPFIKKHSGSK